MTALLSMIARPVVSKTPSASFRLLSACRDGVVRCFVRRAAVTRLREFDDCELRDIGLTRSQIEPAVRGLGTTLTDCPGRLRLPLPRPGEMDARVPAGTRLMRRR